MAESFTADALGAETFEGALVAGIGSNKSGRYVMFQRTQGDPDGIWFEFDDQNNGGYNGVVLVKVAGEHLSIRLASAINGIQEFSIQLAGTVEERECLRAQLQAIYYETPGVLEIHGA